MKAKYILGPFPFSEAQQQGVTLNMIFGRPKPDGTTRPILNLSDKTQQGYSINDELDKDLCTVEYVQQKELIETIKALGKGSYLWAKDLMDGYFNVSIHKNDIRYLGFTFDGNVYVFQVLPFGLSSAPKIFTDFMHFPVWAIKKAAPHLYYLNVKATDVNLEHFRKFADITISKNSDVIRIPIIIYYLDDILGGHPTKEGAWQQYKHSELILRELSLQTKESYVIVSFIKNIFCFVTNKF